MKNDDFELFDIESSTKTSKEESIVIDDIVSPPAKPSNEKRDYIVRNGKKYYKTAKQYIYRCEDGYFAYRLYHKETKANTFVNKHVETGERFNTERRAYDALQEHIKKLGGSIAYKNRKLTFSQLWERFLNDNAKNEQTIRKYNSIFKYHIEPVFGNRHLIDITVGEVNALLEKLYVTGDGQGNGLHGYSYTFVESIIKYFTLVFAYAYNNDLLPDKNYLSFKEGMKMPSKRKQKDNAGIRILTEEQIKKINELLKDTDLYLPFLCSLLCGTRPAETFALCFKDFDYEAKTVTIDKQVVDTVGRLVLKEPKTFARTIEIPDILVEAVKDREDKLKKAREKDPLLFEQNRGKITYGFNYKEEIFDMPDFISTDMKGKYVSYPAFQYYANIIRRDICPYDYNIEDFSFYTFRKTHLSSMAGNNCPVGELMKRAGHTKMETLYKYYYGRTEASKEKCIEAVNATAKLI